MGSLCVMYVTYKTVEVGNPLILYVLYLSRYAWLDIGVISLYIALPYVYTGFYCGRDNLVEYAIEVCTLSHTKSAARTTQA